MSFESWFPIGVTTLLLGGVGYLFRHAISTILTKSVQHEFYKKIEMLKTELKKSEQSFKADLQAKGAEIEALRSSALSGLTSRQVALYKRRIEAVDELWSAVKNACTFKDDFRKHVCDKF